MPQLQELIKDTKRKSEQHSAEWGSPKKLKRDLSMTEDDWTQVIVSQYDQWHQATLANNEMQIRAFSSCLQEYQKNRDSGDLPQAKATELITEAEKKINELTTENIILRSHEYTVKGQYLDSYRRASQTDMAYVDLLVARFLPPYGHTEWFKAAAGRNQQEQDRFRSNVIKRYGSKAQHKNGEDIIWCPIARRAFRAKNVTAAHLVPYSTGEANCCYLFGDTDSPRGHLMDPSNGLMLHSDFEELIDASRIIISPASMEDVDPETQKKVDFDDHEPYKVQVLDASLKVIKADEERTGGIDGDKLDGRILFFKNENRPKKRYLWFVAVINIARRRRCRVQNWEKDKDILGTEMWASPGEWVRRSTMHCIMCRIGFDPTPEETLKLGPTLEGSPEVSPICQEISDRMSLKTSRTGSARHVVRVSSPSDGIVKRGRVLSGPFSKGYSLAKHRYESTLMPRAVGDQRDEEEDEDGDEDESDQDGEDEEIDRDLYEIDD
ncbi:hypothetical protein PMIN06_000258 [Paraphaeosphaeria minitans]